MSEAQARARSTPADCDRIEDELRRVVAARDEVLAIVSHDLRNPLSAAQLSTRLLGELGLDERGRKHLEMIQRAIRNMSRLIDDLLDAVSIDAGKLELDLRAVPVAEVIAELRARNESTTRDRGVELRVAGEASPRAPGVAPDGAILCDRARVLQVFGKLIACAVTFCRAGDAVSIAHQVAGDAVEFSLAQTGQGIDPGLVPHLFEPYWSAPAAIRRRIGMGPYIAKGIVERHGGRIRVDARPGAGTAIAFTLPRAAKPA